MIAFLDTHAFHAFGEGVAGRFGKEARRILVTADLLVSPSVLLELHYLCESGRLSIDPDAFYADVLNEGEVRESADGFAAVIREAKSLAWTRDPFDRLIVGAAKLRGAKLITKDANIPEHFDGAAW